MSWAMGFLTSLILFIISTIVIFSLLKTPSIRVLLKVILLILFNFFLCNSFILFYTFFELSLIPVFFIIIGWGYQPERLEASIWIIMYTLVAAIPFLAIFLLISEGFRTPNFKSLEQLYISRNGQKRKIILEFIIILGFLVKFPMYSFHIWLPRAHVEAPVIGSVLLAAILLKFAGFGL